jgi:WD40 repeat protein
MIVEMCCILVAIKYEPIQRIWNAHRRPLSSVSWYRGDKEWDEYDESEVGWPSVFTVATSSADKTICIWEAPRILKTVTAWLFEED